MSMNDFLKQLTTGDSVKDFAHASKTFVDSGMRLHPKTGFLYHVFFDRNPVLFGGVSADTIEMGMMAKRLSLPKYSMDTKVMNAYNRTDLVQTKIKYDPVTITFHDDMANVVTNFWRDYVRYYYRDNIYAESLYASPHRYDAQRTSSWGFAGDQGSNPFLSAVRIYQLHKKEFTEFTLINPIITSWQHGEQDYGSSDPVEHNVTIQYETVKYKTGYITGGANGSVKGFGDIHYDKSPSPLTPAGSGTRSILGPGGLLDSVTDIAGDVAEGDLLGAIFKGARVAKTMEGSSLKKMAKEELYSFGKAVIEGKNVTSKYSFPGIKSITKLF